MGALSVIVAVPWAITPSLLKGFIGSRISMVILILGFSARFLTFFDRSFVMKKSFWEFSSYMKKPESDAAGHFYRLCIHNRNNYHTGYFVFPQGCLLYTSDAADDLLCVDLGGR